MKGKSALATWFKAAVPPELAAVAQDGLTTDRLQPGLWIPFSSVWCLMANSHRAAGTAGPGLARTPRKGTGLDGCLGAPAQETRRRPQHFRAERLRTMTSAMPSDAKPSLTPKMRFPEFRDAPGWEVKNPFNILDFDFQWINPSTKHGL